MINGKTIAAMARRLDERGGQVVIDGETHEVDNRADFVSFDGYTLHFHTNDACVNVAQELIDEIRVYS
jgi:hypothetical protein